MRCTERDHEWTGSLHIEHCSKHVDFSTRFLQIIGLKLNLKVAVCQQDIYQLVTEMQSVFRGQSGQIEGADFPTPFAQRDRPVAQPIFIKPRSDEQARVIELRHMQLPNSNPQNQNLTANLSFSSRRATIAVTKCDVGCSPDR